MLDCVIKCWHNSNSKETLNFLTSYINNCENKEILKIFYEKNFRALELLSNSTKKSSQRTRNIQEKYSTLCRLLKNKIEENANVANNQIQQGPLTSKPQIVVKEKIPEKRSRELENNSLFANKKAKSEPVNEKEISNNEALFLSDWNDDQDTAAFDLLNSIETSSPVKKC